jgi:MoaA/NifB/PqqE/SkfB family radical SAM enzyme
VSALEFLRGNYLDQPLEVAIETQAVCNARCIFCPYPTIERKGTKMSTELVYRLIDEMAEWDKPSIVSFFKLSEPLLDKRLHDFHQRYNERCPEGALRIFTNGSPLTAARVDEIATLRNVEHLWISLNSHDAGEYERIMGLPFARTAERLDELHARDFPHPVVLSKVGMHGAHSFRLYCKNRWPKFGCFVIKQDRWIDFTDADYPQVPATPCSRWFELSITATGVVSLCCMDSEGKHALGNVTDSTMLEVYNAPHWRKRRELMQSRKEVNVCKGCSY